MRRSAAPLGIGDQAARAAEFEGACTFVLRRDACPLAGAGLESVISVGRLVRFFVVARGFGFDETADPGKRYDDQKDSEDSNGEGPSLFVPPGPRNRPIGRDRRPHPLHDDEANHHSGDHSNQQDRPGDKLPRSEQSNFPMRLHRCDRLGAAEAESDQAQRLNEEAEGSSSGAETHNSGSFAMFAAIHRASSSLSSFAAELRPGSFCSEVSYRTSLTDLAPR